MFLADNAELLKTDLGVLLEEAVSQVLDHDVSAARQCMQSLVILHSVKKSGQSDWKRKYKPWTPGTQT